MGQQWVPLAPGMILFSVSNPLPPRQPERRAKRGTSPPRCDLNPSRQA